MVMSIDRPQSLDAATTWEIDPAASRVAFTLRQHLPFGRRLTGLGRTVVGRFADVSGTIVLEERRPASTGCGGRWRGQPRHRGGTAGCPPPLGRLLRRPLAYCSGLIVFGSARHEEEG